MEIDKLTEQILEITNNSDYGWIDLDSADADRIRVALTQAMNYIPCCTELKYKEAPTFDDYIKENGFTHKIDYTYLDADGNEWLEEEIKILMKPDY